MLGIAVAGLGCLLQVGIAFNLCHLRFDQIFNISLDFVVFIKDDLFRYGSDDRYVLVFAFFFLEGFNVVEDLVVEAFVLDLLFGVIGDGADKLARTQAGDNRSWYGCLQLGGLADRGIVGIYTDGLSFLHDPADTVTEHFGAIAKDLAAYDVPADFHDDFCLVFAVVLAQLRATLDPENGCGLI